MQKIAAVLCFSLVSQTFTLLAQIAPPCPIPAPPGAEACTDACVYCDIDGYMGINDGPFSGGNPLCGQISPHNPRWFGFVAGTPYINFNIFAGNCLNGDGLQAAILESCDQDVLNCDPGGGGMALNGQVLNVFWDDFLPGKTYYLVIDGFLGDICEFEIDVVAGSAYPPPVGIPAKPQGPTKVCANATAEYIIPDVQGAGYYTWTAPPDASINGGGNTATLPAPDGVAATVTFGNLGGAVCVSAGNACFPQTTLNCLNVTNQPVPVTTLPTLVIPASELPFIWDLPPYTIIENPGIFPLQSAGLFSWLGCDSLVKQQIIVTSSDPFTAVGLVYNDLNNNGVQDAGETPYAGGALLQSSSGLMATSATDGTFQFAGLLAGDTIRVIPPVVGMTVNPPFHVFQPSMPSGYTFGLYLPPQGHDLAVDLTNSNPFRQGFITTLTLTVWNKLPYTAPPVTAGLTLPNFLELLDATPAPSSVSGNVLSWNLGAIGPNDSRIVQIKVKTALGTPNGKPVSVPATAQPLTGDVVPTDNVYTLNTATMGSFDPNDKQVSPAYVTPALLANGLPLEYIIRFQNTGNYPADFVTVIDSLGDTVDPATFRFVSASHPCTWRVHGNGVVEFFFPDIFLPDSTSNEAESHGFVKFTVEPNKDLGLGALVENFCDIYFDYNEPVRTNTAGTQVVYFIPGEGIDLSGKRLKVRPNPAAFHIFCDWKQPAPADGRIRLFDLTGLPRLEIPVEEGMVQTGIDILSLSPGLYFILLEAGDLLLSNKVIVVQPDELGDD